MYEIGWFSSGRGPGSRELLATMKRSIDSGQVDASIEFVFCNRERGLSSETDMFIDLVESYSIPLVCFSSVKFRETLSPDVRSDWRVRYDREVMQLLAGFSVELSVLAGYMLVVGPEMCQKYTMVNLHPAAPGGPKGTWREVIWELIEQRAEHTGVMMHLATPELDEGPPVTYCRFGITGEPFNNYWRELQGRSLGSIRQQEGDHYQLFRLIREHGLKREFPLIVATVKAFSEERVSVRQGEIVDHTGKVIPGYDLTPEIDQAVE